MATPITTIDTYSLDQGTTLTINDLAFGVLANDSDADGNTLTATVKWTTANGALNFNTDGTFTYTPYNGFTGTDHFYYEADDGTGNPVLTKVAITVNPSTGGSTGSAPVADTYDVTGSTLTVDAAKGVRANDGAAAGSTVALDVMYSLSACSERADGGRHRSPTIGNVGSAVRTII
jgi:hypothetical protein